MSKRSFEEAVEMAGFGFAPIMREGKPVNWLKDHPKDSRFFVCWDDKRNEIVVPYDLSKVPEPKNPRDVEIYGGSMMGLVTYVTGDWEHLDG